MTQSAQTTIPPYQHLGQSDRSNGELYIQIYQ